VRGVLVTVEGIDGCGKTTQVALLESWLKDKGRAVRSVREPGGVPISERIRELLLDPSGEGMSAITELLLYEASRAQLVNDVIRPALDSGQVVICDRYTDSTMAYQGYGRGLPKEFIAELNIRATNGVVPAKTVVLDIALSEAVRRRKESGPADRLEGEGNPFYERVRRGFLAVAQQEPERVVVVDGTPNAETVADSVRLAVVQSILDDVD